MATLILPMTIGFFLSFLGNVQMVTSTDNELQFGRHTVLLVLITKEYPGECNGK